MKKLEMVMAVMAVGAAFGSVDCDLTRNPEARDGHTPPNPARYFQVVASKDYAANPTSVMLPDDKTILAFWDIHQCGPCGSAAVSTDAGRTWTRIDERLPKEFAADCHDEPKAFRFVDKSGKARIRVFASYGTATYANWRGPKERPLAEAMPSVLSEDDGQTWKYLPPLGADFACVVGFSGMVRLSDGTYLGVFCRGKDPNGDGGAWRVMGSFSRDGGLTWEKPFELLSVGGKSLFVPTVFRSPDGKELCCLAGVLSWEGASAFASFSSDEGKTWSEPRPVADDLFGTEHSVGQLADGRLVVAMHRGSQVVGWLGTFAELKSCKGGVGVQLFHNYGGQRECGSPTVHVRKDGEIVVVAHAQLTLQDPLPRVTAMQFKAEEIDRQAKERDVALHDFSNWKAFEGTGFKPLTKGKFHGPFSLDVVGKVRDCVFKMTPYDGSKGYLTKTCGERFKEMVEKNGTYEIKKYQKHDMGDAAILSWTVQVPEDCEAKMRLIASPSARCFVGKTLVLPAVTATIFEPRTADLKLKKGENEISLMVYHPREREAVESGLAGLPLRIGIGLSCPKGFTCLDPGRNLELKAEDEELSLDAEF